MIWNSTNTLILPLLAALAQAQSSNGTGVNQDNATQVTLIDEADTVLTLNHWTSYHYDKEMYVFNGELELEATSDGKYFDCGFCLQIDPSNESSWDCYMNFFEVDPAQDPKCITKDYYTNRGIDSSLTPDNDFSERNDSAKNWKATFPNGGSNCT